MNEMKGVFHLARRRKMKHPVDVLLLGVCLDFVA